MTAHSRARGRHSGNRKSLIKKVVVRGFITNEEKKYATKKANAQAMRLSSSLTKPLKKPKIKEANKTSKTMISINDINLWVLSDKT